MNLKNGICFFAVVAILTSCEYSYTYSYEIKNSSSNEINAYLRTQNIDTTFYISQGGSQVIYSTSHGIEASNGPYHAEVSKDLMRLIIKNKRLRSKRNFLNNSSWKFEKGHYTTLITDNEF